MKKYLREELERFLVALDQALVNDCEIVVIGGSAAALHYGVTLATRDIDTFTRIEGAIAAAADEARRSTGLLVPLETATVADGPYLFEDRLERILPNLERLTLMVPERHDLVLMKSLRAHEHDLAAIEEIHAHSPLELALLVRRFKDEMGHTIIDPEVRRQKFLVVVERLFPDEVAAVSVDLA